MFVPSSLAALPGHFSPELHESRGRPISRTLPATKSINEWQNFASANRNQVLARFYEATKLGYHLVTPPLSPPPSKPPPNLPHEQIVNRIRNIHSGDWPLVSEPSLPLPLSASDFTTEPRRAPEPPKRILRPPSELFLPPMPSTPPVFQDKRIPQEFSASSQEAKVTYIQTNLQIPIRESPQCSSDRTILPLRVQSLPRGRLAAMVTRDSTNMANTQTALNIGHNSRSTTTYPRGKPIQQQGRASTVPPYLNRNSSLQSSRPARYRNRNTMSLHAEPRTFSRVLKVDRPSSVHRPGPGFTLPRTSSRNRPSSAVIKSFKIQPSTGLPTMATELGRGGTLSVFVRNDLLPIKDMPCSGDDLVRTAQHRRRRGSDSVSPKRIKPARSLTPEPHGKVLRGNTGQRRSPDAKTNGNVVGGFDFEFGRVSSTNSLAMIPENAKTADDDAGPTTPVATRISLRSGSVVTVVPCEMNAWQTSTYLQGPIKLPKPTIVPRKNSLATLDPFQEAVDQVYQQALVKPRRESDNAVEHEICDYFDSFGFERVGFGHDNLDGSLRDTRKGDGVVVAELVEQHNSSPMERRVAKESIVCRSFPASQQGVDVQAAPHASVPACSYRRESLTLGGRIESTAGMLLPLPEEGMLLDPYRLSLMSSVAEETGSYMGSTGSSGFDWDDDVSEIEAAPIWVAPTAATPKSHPLSRDTATKRTRNPVAKLRRLVATASAIL